MVGRSAKLLRFSSILVYILKLQNAATLAIVAVHTAENEPPKVLKKSGKNRFCIQNTVTAGIFCNLHEQSTVLASL